MPELSTVEYDYDLEKYVAILSDGAKIALEATTLRSAEEEAVRYIVQNEYTNFTAAITWE